MAITRLPTKNGQGYIVLCLSSDTKPTSTTPGVLVETNTGIPWYPDGGGGWTAAGGGSPGSGSASIDDFRLTLSSGNPLYNPYPSGNPASTDTGAETITFSTNHNWTNGTLVTPQTTGGGITAETRYFVHVVSATTISFHTTVADALSGSSPVNLTGSVTSRIFPSGVSNTTLYLSPWSGNSIGLYSGSAWAVLTSAEVSIALGTLTSGKNYDVFAYNSSGTLTLELLAWTSDNARATALVRQDGIWAKTGALTRRYVGTIRTDSTTTTIDDGGGLATNVGGKRYVYNANNRISRNMFVFDSTATWSYNVATWRQAHGNAGNQVEWVDGLQESIIDARLDSAANQSGSGASATIGIGLNQVITPDLGGSATQYGLAFAPAGSITSATSSSTAKAGSPGYNFAAWMEIGGGAGTTLWIGETGGVRSGLSAVVDM